MIEQGKTEEYGGSGGFGRVAALSSPFGVYKNSFTNEVAPTSYHPYPPPLAKYEEVVANTKLFMETLEKLHAAMGTKFMIPIIGGRDLDLHRLFVEVTRRGGIEKIMSEKRWKDVTASFSFPSTATNASYVLRKYYYSLLQHYEQIYFFKAPGWTPLPLGSVQSSSVPVAVHGLAETSSPVHTASTQPLRAFNVESVPGATTAVATPSVASSSSSVGCPVIGVIDGKFESGYLVTVKVGTEMLKGVIYRVPGDPVRQVTPQHSSIFTNRSDAVPPATGVKRRRRRKKSEIRRRDPAHPKPNRSGYNFFFAEQHAKLKPLYSGKDREISRTIGELWTNLSESDRTVYQEKALKDKERYRLEMEDYRRLKAGSSQVRKEAATLQQRDPGLDSDMMEGNAKDGIGGDSPGTPEDEDVSYCSISDDEDDGIVDSNLETTENAELGKSSDRCGEDRRNSLGQKINVPNGKTKDDRVAEGDSQDYAPPGT